VAQARDYANTAESKGTETNWDSINFTSSALPFPRRNAADQSCNDFQRNKQRQRPSSTHASAPLANEKHKGEKELRTNAGHQITRQQKKVCKPYPKNLPPNPAFRSLTNAATTARIRDSTVSPLLNKRVRCVVDEANGLMHLRPRESTYSAQEYNAAQSIGMNCGSLSMKLRIGRKSGGEAGKAHTNGMRFLALVEL
jgi:hypothetical protein